MLLQFKVQCRNMKTTNIGDGKSMQLEKRGRKEGKKKRSTKMQERSSKFYQNVVEASISNSYVILYQFIFRRRIIFVVK